MSWIELQQERKKSQSGRDTRGVILGQFKHVVNLAASKYGIYD